MTDVIHFGKMIEAEYTPNVSPASRYADLCRRKERERKERELDQEEHF